MSHDGVEVFIIVHDSVVRGGWVGWMGLGEGVSGLYFVDNLLGNVDMRLGLEGVKGPGDFLSGGEGGDALGFGVELGVALLGGGACRAEDGLGGFPDEVVEVLVELHVPQL